MLLFGFVWTFRESIYVRIFDTDRLFIPLSREEIGKKEKRSNLSINQRTKRNLTKDLARTLREQRD